MNQGLKKSGVLTVPIYEYQCVSCEHRLENLQKMSQDDLVECPECKQPALKRLVSAAAFRLKGAGWYETDFKQDNKRNLAESSDNESPKKDSSEKKSGADSSKKADKPTSGTSTKKSEAKPAAKSASKE
jgi:putative FmdB family regulatory protein